MKKIVTILLTLCLLAVTFTGCSEGKPAPGEGTTDPTTNADFTPGPLSEEQLGEIERYLNNPANYNYGFFNKNVYARPEDIDLFMVFFGGSVDVNGTSYEEWSEQEMLDILGVASMDFGHYFARKYARADVEDFILRKTGISLSSMTAKPNEDFPYFKNPREDYPYSGEPNALMFSSKYDAYYKVVPDPDFEKEALVSEGEILENGLYAIKYRSESNINPAEYILTLRKVDGGFQFVSNIKVK